MPVAAAQKNAKAACSPKSCCAGADAVLERQAVEACAMDRTHLASCATCPCQNLATCSPSFASKCRASWSGLAAGLGRWVLRWRKPAGPATTNWAVEWLAESRHVTASTGVGRRLASQACMRPRCWRCQRPSREEACSWFLLGAQGLYVQLDLGFEFAKVAACLNPLGPDPTDQ